MKTLMTFSNMKVIVKSRQAGKTTQCVKWVMEKENRLLLVPFGRIKQMILKNFKDFGITDKKIITVSELPRASNIPVNAEAYVDDAEWVLKEMLSRTMIDVKGMTVTLDLDFSKPGKRIRKPFPKIPEDPAQELDKEQWEKAIN